MKLCLTLFNLQNSINYIKGFILAAILCCTCTSTLFAQNPKLPGTDSEQTQYIQQFTGLFPDTADLIVHRKFLFNEDQTFQIPAFGLNAFIQYDSLGMGDLNNNDTIDSEEFNIGDPVLQSVIRSLGSSHLRYMGGTPSNGWNFHNMELRASYSGSTLDALDETYFVDREDFQEHLSNGTFDFTNFSYYMHEEGSHFTSNLMKLSAADISNDTINNGYFLSFSDASIILFASSTYYQEGSPGLGLAFENEGSQNVSLSNHIDDFIDLTYDSNIIPIYVLRMFDPLNYVVAFGDGVPDYDSTNVDIFTSPVLNARMQDHFNTSTDYDICNHYDSISEYILEDSEHEVRRQLVKYVYEYFKHFSASADLDSLLSDFQSYINTVKNDTEWETFVDSVQAHDLFPQIQNMEINFEMGNELWAKYYYKYLPNDIGCTDPTDVNTIWDSLTTSEFLYTEIAKVANLLVKDVFPSAKTGLVGGDRSGNCDWMTEISSNVDYPDDFDAWIPHYYADQIQQYGAFDPTDLLADSNEFYLTTAITHYYFQMELDQQSGVNHYDTIPLWITEYGIENQCEFDSLGNIIGCLGPLPGSWLDMMVKFNLTNQMMTRSQQFATDINSSSVNNANLMFNTTGNGNDAPALNTDLLMLHTLGSGLRGSIQITPNGGGQYDFRDQGLLQLIFEKFTEDGHDQLSPLGFTIDTLSGLIADVSGITSGNYFDHDTLLYRCSEDSINLNIHNPLFYGWMSRKDSLSDCLAYRYLLVNSSHESLEINGMNDINTENADLFLFDFQAYEDSMETQLSQLNIDNVIVDEIQDPTVVGTYDLESYFCYYTGDLNDTVIGIDFNTKIIMPPYSVMIFEGDPNNILDNLETTDYFELDEPPIYSVTSDTTWTGNFFAFQDIFVEDSVTLILDNCSIHFAENTGIVVKREAELDIISNSDLTSMSCNSLWNGIEVWGVSSSQGNCCPDPKPWGVLTMDSSSVMHAEIGVSLFKRNDIFNSFNGGQFSINNSTFTNNFQSIKAKNSAMKVQDQNGIGTTDFIVDGYMRGWDQLQKDTASLAFAQIVLRGNSMVLLKENTLTIDTALYKLPHRRGAGISTLNQYLVAEENTIDNFNEGIWCRGLSGASGYTLLDSNEFNNNIHSIVLDNIFFGRAVGNTINIPKYPSSVYYTDILDENYGANNHVGIYLLSGYGNMVEENHIYGVDDVALDSLDQNRFTFGIVASETGTVDVNPDPLEAVATSELYMNDIHDVQIALQVEGHNGVPGGLFGLELICNDFSDNSLIYDARVVGNMITDTIIAVGSLKNQGTCNAITEQADNQFTACTSGTRNFHFGDYTLAGDSTSSDTIDYRGFGTLIPDCYDLIVKEFDCQLGASNPCPTHQFVAEWNEFGELEDKRDTIDQTIDDLEIGLADAISRNDTLEIEELEGQLDHYEQKRVLMTNRMIHFELVDSAQVNLESLLMEREGNTHSIPRLAYYIENDLWTEADSLLNIMLADSSWIGSDPQLSAEMVYNAKYYGTTLTEQAELSYSELEDLLEENRIQSYNSNTFFSLMGYRTYKRMPWIVGDTLLGKSFEAGNSGIVLSESKLNIWPNPNEGFMNFEINSDEYDKGEDYQIYLYSYLGQLVAQESIQNSNGTLNFADLERGIYLLNLRKNATLIESKKIIIY